jgi:hypothetical protein
MDGTSMFVWNLKLLVSVSQLVKCMFLFLSLPLEAGCDDSELPLLLWPQLVVPMADRPIWMWSSS